MKIGMLLLKLRKARRLSQSEVAERIGVCQSAYCAWEGDRATPKAQHYGPLAALFGVDLTTLLAGGPVGGLPLNVLPLPVASPPVVFQDDLIQAQRETITLQKQWIEQLEAENQQLQQRLAPASQLASGALIIISVLNFSTTLLELITEPFAIG